MSESEVVHAQFEGTFNREAQEQAGVRIIAGTVRSGGLFLYIQMHMCVYMYICV